MLAQHVAHGVMSLLMESLLPVRGEPELETMQIAMLPSSLSCLATLPRSLAYVCLMPQRLDQA